MSTEENFCEYDAILKEQNYYFYSPTIQFLLNSIEDEKNNRKNQLKVIGIDAGSGYGKSYNAKYLYNIINKKKAFDVISDKKAKIQIPSGILENTAIYISLEQYDSDYSFEHILYIFYETIMKFIERYNKELEQYELDSVQINDVIKILKKNMIEITKYVMKKTSFAPLVEIGNMINTSYNELKKSSSMGPQFESEKATLKKHQKFQEDLKSILDFVSKINPIIIIDNIDKCKPKFTIEFMETVKYIFKDQKITFLFMIDFEYLKNLAEGIYGNNTDLQFFYSLIFTKITKMYLKNKKEFIHDMINTLELNNFKKIYKNYVKKYINFINKVNSLSLFEIEKTIKRIERFLEYNQFLLLDDLHDQTNKFIRPEPLINLMYSLIAMQNSNIKSFNKFLYDDASLDFNIYNDDNGENYTAVISNYNKNILVIDNTIFSLLESDDPLKKTFKIAYLKTSIGFLPIPFYENCTLNLTERDNVKIEYNNSGMDTGVNKKDFVISMLFNFEDSQIYTIEELFNFTFREYLRFKLSQI